MACCYVALGAPACGCGRGSRARVFDVHDVYPWERTMSQKLKHSGSDLMTELTNGQDDFEVDLMACGCRFQIDSDAMQSMSAMNLQDLLRMYNFDSAGMARFIEGLVSAGGITDQQIFSIAEQALKPAAQVPVPHASVQGSEVHAS